MKTTISDFIGGIILNLNCATEVDNALDCDTFFDYMDGDFDEMFDYVRELVEGKHEYIYYASAMDYLRTDDVMLTESLEYAEEMGFKPSDLNSCILASIHAQRTAMDEVYKEEEEIKIIFDLFKDIMSHFDTDDIHFEIDSEDDTIIEMMEKYGLE